MPTISELKAGLRDKTAVNLFCDDKFAFSIPLELVLSRQLKVGKILTFSELESLKTQKTLNQVIGKSLNFLSFRARSAKEMQDRVEKYTSDPKIGRDVLDYLINHGYIDDQKFAILWVSSRSHKISRQKLIYELKLKGVSEECITNAFIGNNTDEHALAQFIEKKTRYLKFPLVEKTRARVLRAGLSRGFKYLDLINALLQKM